ncbi:hypothetical protein [Streptomyces sp. 769]|uniref:hypothetical protein n=1 Tax=Streptomyces sp. 769 TaxID=1262452 RepID=UPI00058061DF|nr:hypothetical protein [Streptomyces sp. 769]AJC60168.1 phage protein [Streptomyces sp. 769]
MTSRNRPAAVLALAQGRTNGQAAKAAGVSGRTILRWLDDPEFRQEVDGTRTELLHLAVGRLAAASTKAVDALVDALDNERGQARVQAARTLLDACLSLRESLDLEQRLAALETAEGNER